MKSINEQIILDEKDKWILTKYKWNFNRYISVYINKKSVLLHHLILPFKKGYYVDHINRNTLDNRRCNLRYLTPSESNFNRRIRKENISGCSGVTYDKKVKKWRANFFLNKKRITLGFFRNLNDAIDARKSEEAKYFCFIPMKGV